MLLQVARFHPFLMAEEYSIVCIYHLFFIHLSVNGCWSFLNQQLANFI